MACLLALATAASAAHGKPAPTGASETEPGGEAMVYYPKPVKGPIGTAPACMPFILEVTPKSVTLRDPDGVWGSSGVYKAVWDSDTKYSTFDECLAAVPAYKDRYTPAMLGSLQAGQLDAGMPFEFALMILGPAGPQPGTLRVLNPMTGEPETRQTFTWQRMPRQGRTLRTIFFFAQVVSLGIANTTSNFGMAIDALNVASAAGAAGLLMDLRAIDRMHTVTIQVADDGKITMLNIQ
jgi:hypothetical protein